MKIGAFEFFWWPADDEVDWERRWETGLSTAARGSEEREIKRAVGLKSLGHTARPNTLEERAALGMAIREGLTTGKACMPFYGRGTALAADVTGTSVSLVDNLWGFAAADFVFLLDPQTRLWEVIGIASVAGSVLTLSSGVSRTYRAGTLVWPLIFGKLICENWDAVENHRADPRLQIVENDPGFSKAETSCPVTTTYLGRPIAPLSIDWSSPVRQSFRYPLNEAMVGFGKSDYAAVQDYVVNGWEFTVLLNGAAAIKAWDCLTAGMPGRAAGFWLQDASAIFRISSSPSSKKVQAVDSGLTETWASDPAVVLIFTKPGAAAQIAQIVSVGDLGGGVEEITVDVDLTGIDATWEAHRLRYVRLADDVERGKFIADQIQYRSLTVIELPEEYTSLLPAHAPLWLYTFWVVTAAGNVYWRYTSYGANVTSNGNLFTSLNLSHGELKRSVQPDQDAVQIEGFYTAGNIFAYALGLPALNVWCQIEETTQPAPDTTTILFIGLLSKPASPEDANGRKVNLTFASAIDVFGSDVPNWILGVRCPFQLYGRGCEEVETNYRVSVVIATISADRRTITVTGAGLTGNNLNGFDKTTANYWAWGWIVLGTGVNNQIVTVLKSATAAGVATLNLSRPLGTALVGDTITLTPGCDRLSTTCTAKFNNYANVAKVGAFGGQPFMPASNPALPPLADDFRSGAKK